MRVVVSGQSGLDKRAFLSQVSQLCNKKQADEVDKSVLLDEVALKDSHIDCVFDLENEFQKKEGSKNYLDMNESEFINGKKHLLEELSNSYPTDKNIIMAMHFTYFRKKSFYHRLDWKSLRKFSPDLIITLIDDVNKIHSKIIKRRDPDDYVRSVNLHDLLVWREVEIMTSETMAQNLYEDRKIPHYIVGVNHGPQMLYQLMFETKKKKVYASYPITSAKEGKIPQEEINEFIAKLKRYFIVFDPYTIREKKLHDLVIQQLSGPLPKSESIEVDGQIYHVDDLLRIILELTVK